jgi:dTDP-4-dehydrorhamnose reductase
MLAGRCRVTATYFRNRRCPEGVKATPLDLRDGAGIRGVMGRESPEVVFHAAAITDVDRCERDPRETLTVNFESTVRLAAGCRSRRARMVFVSTDLVFDGNKGNYVEDDPARPLSIYGTSKLRGEEAVLDFGGNLVVRPSLFYGWGSPSSGTFLTGMVERLRRREEMSLFTDQMRSPILVDDLAAGMVRAVELDLEGLYHLGGPEAISRYDFGLRTCEVLGLDPRLLKPIRMAEFPYVAGRPLDSTLAIGRFTAASGWSPSGIREGLGKVGRPPQSTQIST